MCPSHLVAVGIRALTVNTKAQHCLLGHKACLPPCQLVTLSGGPTPSGQLSLEASLRATGTSCLCCLWFPSDFLWTCGLICSVFHPSRDR